MTTHNRDKVIAIAEQVKANNDMFGDFSVALYAIAFEAGRQSVDTPVALAEAYRCGEEAGRQAELEECAKVCENNYLSEEIDWWLAATKKDVSAKAARKCAEAIRARGDTK